MELTELKKQVLSKISESELENRLNEKLKAFNGFITKEIGLKLVARDIGIYKSTDEKIYTIKDIPKNGRGINLTAKIIKIMPKVVYPSGKASRSMVLSDDTGYISLKLWEDSIKMFEQFKLGDVIRVSGAYARNGELGLGYKGDVKIIAPSPFVEFDKLQERDYVNVHGFVKSKIGYGYYEPERKAKRY